MGNKIPSTLAAAMVLVGGLLVVAPGFWLTSYAAYFLGFTTDRWGDSLAPIATFLAVLYGLACLVIGILLIAFGVFSSQRTPHGDGRA